MEALVGGGFLSIMGHGTQWIQHTWENTRKQKHSVSEVAHLAPTQIKESANAQIAILLVPHVQVVLQLNATHVTQV